MSYNYGQKEIYEKVVRGIENNVIQSRNFYFINEEKDSYQLSDLKPITLDEIDYLIKHTRSNEELFGILHFGLVEDKENQNIVVPQTLLDAIMEHQQLFFERLLEKNDKQTATKTNELFIHQTLYYLSKKPGKGVREAIRKNLATRNYNR